MVECDHDGLLGQLVVGHGVVRREPVGADVVVDGLRHPVEEDSCANPTGEEHAEPGGVVVLRFTVIWAYLDIAVLTEVNNSDKYQPDFLKH